MQGCREKVPIDLPWVHVQSATVQQGLRLFYLGLTQDSLDFITFIFYLLTHLPWKISFHFRLFSHLSSGFLVGLSLSTFVTGCCASLDLGRSWQEWWHFFFTSCMWKTNIQKYCNPMVVTYAKWWNSFQRAFWEAFRVRPHFGRIYF